MTDMLNESFSDVFTRSQDRVKAALAMQQDKDMFSVCIERQDPYATPKPSKFEIVKSQIKDCVSGHILTIKRKIGTMFGMVPLEDIDEYR